MLVVLVVEIGSLRDVVLAALDVTEKRSLRSAAAAIVTVLGNGSVDTW